MSSPTKPFFEVDGLSVSLDRLLYQRVEREESGGCPHCFTYYLTIRNRSDTPVTILGRKWVVTHDDGSVLVVEGDGVVGETPQIPPGDSFSYHSRHLIGTSTAVVDGAYFGRDEQERWIRVRIPRFHLAVPGSTGET